MSATEEIYKPGLEGIIAGETEICSVEQGGLFYRGYTIQDLAQHATFEETAYLLLYGELPRARHLNSFKQTLTAFRPLPSEVIETLRVIPKEVPSMDVLRTAVSMADHYYEAPQEDNRLAWLRHTLFLVSQIAGIIAARQRLIEGQEPVAPKPELSHAAQLLYQITGKEVDPMAAGLLDLTMILYAEHEFNASTFAARVCASTLSDLTSCVVSGIGTLKGPLHGGANESAMKMLKQFETPEAARDQTLKAIAEKKKIMGFGHRVYKHGDHRAFILEAKMRELAYKKGQERWLDIYDAVRDTMDQEKKIFPNVDFPCGLTYYLLGLPIDLYTSLFVASRVVGWCAHAIEQHFDNRIIRPRSRYAGYAQRPYIQINYR